jgi:small-conductance mechanosensitive channel
MRSIVSSEASDAAQSLADSLNQGEITGWDLVAAVLVLVASLPLARLAAATVRRALQRAGIASADVAADLGRLAKWLVYLCSAAVAFSILGVNIGFLSVAFAFALVIGALMLKPMVENSASGILLLARPMFSVGDQIETTEFRGTIEEIGSRATRLRTDDGVIVYVSNNQVLGNPILVFSKSDSRKASFQITIPADTDLDDATSAIMPAVTSVDDVVDDPAPAVQATRLVDDALTLSISYWYPATMSSSSGVTDAVIRATISALSGAGIQLTVRRVEVAQGSAERSSSASSANGGEGSDGGGDKDDSSSTS